MRRLLIPVRFAGVVLAPERAKISALIFVIASFGACNCGDNLSGVPGDARGRVCHPDTGAGLPNAAVILDGPLRDAESIADANGNYIFERMPAGTYALTASLGDIVRTFDVQIVAREIAIVDDSACRGDPNPGDTGNLDGQICNRHTGRLITEGEVILELANGELMLTQTDSDGYFLLTGVPDGEHIVTIRGEGFQRAFLVEIERGVTTTLDLGEGCDPVSATEGGIVGSFCDPDTQGDLVGADVTVQPTAGGEIVTDITDLSGQFEVNGLTPGSYRVDVRNGGSVNFTEAQVEVIAGQLATVTDPSNCADRPQYGRIEGQICDIEAGGRFVGNVDLILGVTVIESTVSDSEGRFAFNALSPGTYTVRAHAGAFERVFAALVVEPFLTTFIQEIDCPAPEQCQTFESVPQVDADGRIMLVVDRSGSMGENVPGTSQEKWDAMRIALENVTAQLTATVEFGLVLYPDNDVCAQGSQALPLAFNNATAIRNVLDNVNPEGGTPTAASLNVARQLITPFVSDGRPLAVLLATDGGPNCNQSIHFPQCRCSNQQEQDNGNCSINNCLDDVNAIDAVGRIKDLGVSTFIVGVPGVENFSDVLSSMAVVGGTALPGAVKYYEANDQAALQASLEAITNRVLSCRVQVTVDLNAVDSITVSVGNQALTRDVARQNGWDVTTANSVELFGSACDLASSSTENVVVRTCDSP